jgi:hypothetical protein
MTQLHIPKRDIYLMVAVRKLFFFRRQYLENTKREKINDSGEKRVVKQKRGEKIEMLFMFKWNFFFFPRNSISYASFYIKRFATLLSNAASD